MVRVKPKQVDAERKSIARAVSKDGYPFEPTDDHWRLNKDVQIALGLPGAIDAIAEAGFRATLLRYAEEASARHTRNMETRFKRYLRDTGLHLRPAEFPRIGVLQRKRIAGDAHLRRRVRGDARTVAVHRLARRAGSAVAIGAGAARHGGPLPGLQDPARVVVQAIDLP